MQKNNKAEKVWLLTDPVPTHPVPTQPPNQSQTFLEVLEKWKMKHRARPHIHILELLGYWLQGKNTGSVDINDYFH